MANDVPVTVPHGSPWAVFQERHRGIPTSLFFLTPPKQYPCQRKVVFSLLFTGSDTSGSRSRWCQCNELFNIFRMGGLRVLGHHEGCVLTKSPCYFWKSWSWRDINRHWMQQTGETTSIPKVDPSKTMGFNHLQLMAETALSTRNSNRENWSCI